MKMKNNIILAMTRKVKRLFFLSNFLSFLEIIELPIVITISGKNLGLSFILSKVLSIQLMNFSWCKLEVVSVKIQTEGSLFNFIKIVQVNNTNILIGCR